MAEFAGASFSARALGVLQECVLVFLEKPERQRLVYSLSVVNVSCKLGF